MKLKELINPTLERMNTMIKEKEILEFKREGVTNHWYIKDPDIWFSSIVIHAIWKPNEICEWYKKYNCNDDHIRTLAVYCCKKKGWI